MSASMDSIGSSATSAPDSSAPPAMPRLSIGAAGTEPAIRSGRPGRPPAPRRRTTNSSGPLSRARKTPWRTFARTNMARVWATMRTPSDSSPDDAREDQDRPSTERIRQPAGRQLQGEDDEPLGRGSDTDLGQGQTARQHQQHADRDQQPGWEPAKADRAPGTAAAVTGASRAVIVARAQAGRRGRRISTGRASGSSGSGSRYRSTTASISALSSATRRGDKPEEVVAGVADFLPVHRPRFRGRRARPGTDRQRSAGSSVAASPRPLWRPGRTRRRAG